MEWVIAGRLVRGRRPGYLKLPDGTKTVDWDRVPDWIREARALRIQSILCLLEHRELALYEQPGGGGLLGYYRREGFNAKSVPLTDYEAPTSEQLRDALAAFQGLREPVLVHCSGGEGRTGAVIEYLKKTV